MQVRSFGSRHISPLVWIYPAHWYNLLHPYTEVRTIQRTIPPALQWATRIVYLGGHTLYRMQPIIWSGVHNWSSFIHLGDMSQKKNACLPKEPNLRSIDRKYIVLTISLNKTFTQSIQTNHKNEHYRQMKESLFPNFMWSIFNRRKW